MRYRSDKTGKPISQLGFGCMRFTRSGGGIDLAKAEAEVCAAIDAGVNYFDTAYLYPGSEDALGKILERTGRRDRVNIATKLPQYSTHTLAAIDRTFREELKRLRTDHVDYYLMHMFTDLREWEFLRSIGMEAWLDARQAEGSIRAVGFSYHGDSAMFLKILDARDWDICQIQYNYMDETSQAGRAGLHAAAAKGIPVVIMEPLRGGKLARLPERAEAVLRATGRGWSGAQWGLRWLWDQSEVTCVLSGMNSLEMVADNCAAAAEAAPGDFTDADRSALEQVRAILRESEKVGCTGCRYCMPCPKGVDIPGVFHYYNLLGQQGRLETVFEYARNMGLRENPGYPDLCVRCGKCEQHCPQRLPIREKLREADRALRPFPVPAAMKLVRRFVVK